MRREQPDRNCTDTYILCLLRLDSAAPAAAVADDDDDDDDENRSS